MTTEPSLNIEDLRRVAEAAIADHADDVARAAPDDRPDLWDAPVAEVPASQLLSLLDRISSVEAERDERFERKVQDYREALNRAETSEARALSLEAERGRLREALEKIASIGHGLELNDTPGERATYWFGQCRGSRSIASQALAEIEGKPS